MTLSTAVLPLRARVLQRAHALGFDLVGIASAEPFEAHRQAAQTRVRQGRMEGMAWFTEERVQRAADPQALLPGARSIVVVGLSYLPPEEVKRADGQTGNVGDFPSVRPGPLEGGERKEQGSQPLLPTGKVARYARWTDYHSAIKAKLLDLAAALPAEAGHGVRARVFVDDGPLLERAAAERAGLGWFGKNTNILTPSHGSWVFLGALVTDLPLEPDAPLKKTCGACVRCIPACPTRAIVSPYILDAPRCISYLTIEHQGPIPSSLRPLVGDWVFGCDLCQEVCPVNRKAQAAAMPTLKRTGYDALELLPLLSMTQEQFSARFRNTPVQRAKRAGIQRNACVALGNLGDQRAVPGLGLALKEGEALVRGHAAWALGRLGGQEAERLLRKALARETDPYVQGEVVEALRAAGQERGGPS